MLFCHRFVNNFFGNLQKTFCEGFLKPRCFMRRGRFYAHPSCLSTTFFSFFRKSSFRNLQRKAVFQAANATFTLLRQECQSFSQKIFQEHVFSFRLSSAHMDSPSKISACCAVFPLSVQRLSTSLRHFIDRRTVSVLRFFPLFCAAGLSFSLWAGVPRPIRQKPKALPGFLRVSGPSFSSAGNTSRPSDTTTSHQHPSCPIHVAGGFFSFILGSVLHEERKGTAAEKR